MRRPVAAVWLMAGVYASVFAYLSVQRHNTFWTGRFDMGNMVQAVWSTAQGRPLESTSVGGEQFVRLGAHVDPVLVLFAPLAWTGHLPEALVIAQAVVVALGALPAYALGRRWLGGEGWGVAAAAVYLLYPPLQWATLAEFHPVTLAAPLLMACIWAAEERRYGLLALAAVGAALTKEQVGLALAMLGLWMAWRGARRAGAWMAGAGVAWSLLCVTVIIPAFNRGDGSAFVSRYEHLGDGPAGIVLAGLTRPWEVSALLLEPGRLLYLLALLGPLLFLPLGAPLLAAGALPELALNMLADWYPQQSFRYHYVAVIAPFAVAAAILGLARLRERWPRARRVPPRVLGGVVVGWVALAGVVMGPLPWWGAVPLGSDQRTEQYRPDDHARALSRAVALVPDGARVSAGNLVGAHLSARRRILFFPQIDDAEWIVVDRQRPFMYGSLAPVAHETRLSVLRADPAWRVVSEEDGVVVLRRTGTGR